MIISYFRLELEIIATVMASSCAALLLFAHVIMITAWFDAYLKPQGPICV